MKTVYVKRQLKDNEILYVTEKQFKELNMRTNLTIGYIVRDKYFDGVIIVGKNNIKYDEIIKITLD